MDMDSDADGQSLYHEDRKRFIRKATFAERNDVLLTESALLINGVKRFSSRLSRDLSRIKRDIKRHRGTNETDIGALIEKFIEKFDACKSGIKNQYSVLKAHFSNNKDILCGKKNHGVADIGVCRNRKRIEEFAFSTTSGLRDLAFSKIRNFDDEVWTEEVFLNHWPFLLDLIVTCIAKLDLPDKVMGFVDKWEEDGYLVQLLWTYGKSVAWLSAEYTFKSDCHYMPIVRDIDMFVRRKEERRQETDDDTGSDVEIHSVGNRKSSGNAKPVKSYRKNDKSRKEHSSPDNSPRSQHKKTMDGRISTLNVTARERYRHRSTEKPISKTRRARVDSPNQTKQSPRRRQTGEITVSESDDDERPRKTNNRYIKKTQSSKESHSRESSADGRAPAKAEGKYSKNKRGADSDKEKQGGSMLKNVHMAMSQSDEENEEKAKQKDTKRKETKASWRKSRKTSKECSSDEEKNRHSSRAQKKERSPTPTKERSPKPKARYSYKSHVISESDDESENETSGSNIKVYVSTKSKDGSPKTDDQKLKAGKVTKSSRKMRHSSESEPETERDSVKKSQKKEPLLKQRKASNEKVHVVQSESSDGDVEKAKSKTQQKQKPWIKPRKVTKQVSSTEEEESEDDKRATKSIKAKSGKIKSSVSETVHLAPSSESDVGIVMSKPKEKSKDKSLIKPKKASKEEHTSDDDESEPKKHTTVNSKNAKTSESDDEALAKLIKECNTIVVRDRASRETLKGVIKKQNAELDRLHKRGIEKKSEEKTKDPESDESDTDLKNEIEKLKRENAELKKSVEAHKANALEITNSDPAFEDTNIKVHPTTVIERYTQFCNQEWLDAKRMVDKWSRITRGGLDECIKCIILTQTLEICYKETNALYDRIRQRAIRKFHDDIQTTLDDDPFDYDEDRETAQQTKGQIEDKSFDACVSKQMKIYSETVTFHKAAKKLSKAICRQLSDRVLDSVSKTKISTTKRQNIAKDISYDDLAKYPAFTTFVAIALELSWKMVIQQPAMRFICGPGGTKKREGEREDAFDATRHVAHYGSDDARHPNARVDYVVCPMLVQGDRVMKKAKVWLRQGGTDNTEVGEPVNDGTTVGNSFNGFLLHETV